MKKTLLISAILIAFTKVGYNQKKADIDLLKLTEHKQLFIGKSLSKLLHEIDGNPTIVYGHRGINGSMTGGRIVFYFDSRQMIDSLRKKNITPLTLTVYVVEFFEMDDANRFKEKKNVWTKSDEEKYGKLTIESFYFSGVK